MHWRIYKICCVYVPVFFLAIMTHAQVAINFNASIFGQSLEGLSYVQLFNSSGEDVRAKVTIQVKEFTAGNVLTATLISVPVRRGSNTLDRGYFQQVVFHLVTIITGLL